MKKACIVLTVLLLAAAPGAAQDPAEELDRRVGEASKKVVDAFVFIAGGSGVIISEDGYFVTCHHVAGNMKGPVTITLSDGSRPQAELVGTDPVGDVTLFKIREAKGLPFVELGDSDALRPGQYVIAVGNPFGLGYLSATRRRYPAVSLGIVSAVHRYQGGYSDAIQTDAAVNPGNSGGPLATLEGKLVGLNGRIATRYYNRVNSGVGYAIPVNQIRNFLPRFKEADGGTVRHGEIQGLNILRSHTGGAGARVSSVENASVAEEAGFKDDDLIVRINGQPVWSYQRCLGVIGTYPNGSELAVIVRRGDEDVELSVLLSSGQRPRGSGRLGVTLQDSDDGVLVDYVVPLGPGDEAGLQVGDLIKKVNGRAVRRWMDVRNRVWSRKPGDKLRMVILRDGEEKEVVVTLGKHPED
ncbi:MAG: S1C family serine protease [Planctomycetota bacterium]|jgi:serine protease Do